MHTPGPWAKDSGNGKYTVTGANGHYVCSVQIKQIGPPALHEWMESERLANLELILAAPELLEALERLAAYGNVFRHRAGEASPYEQAVAAIAKAKGGNQDG